MHHLGSSQTAQEHLIANPIFMLFECFTKKNLYLWNLHKFINSYDHQSGYCKEIKLTHSNAELEILFLGKCCEIMVNVLG